MSARNKSHSDRLFGAACIKLMLERTGGAAQGKSIYEETLAELGVTNEEVEAFVDGNRARIVESLSRSRRAKDGS
ncbi:MAG: hypothetical protein HYV07_17290 [Deltaproteobacteria bacterium]|nr:hypothetical protein [Deltaproteobacteria bacterium]